MKKMLLKWLGIDEESIVKRINDEVEWKNRNELDELAEKIQAAVEDLIKENIHYLHRDGMYVKNDKSIALYLMNIIDERCDKVMKGIGRDAVESFLTSPNWGNKNHEIVRQMFIDSLTEHERSLQTLDSNYIKKVAEELRSYRT